MEFKKMMGILAITVTIIVISLFGFSYAWYSLTEGSTTFNNVKTTSSNLAIVFAQSQYVNTTTGIPIASSEVATKADKTLFTITGNATTLAGYTVTTEISLININISAALKVNDFKYALLQTVDGTTTTIATGTGATIGNNTTLVLKNMSAITLGKTYSYELRIWLEDTGVSQNQLMNQSFSAKIQVSSAYKK